MSKSRIKVIFIKVYDHLILTLNKPAIRNRQSGWRSEVFNNRWSKGSPRQGNLRTASADSDSRPKSCRGNFAANFSGNRRRRLTRSKVEGDTPCARRPCAIELKQAGHSAHRNCQSVAICNLSNVYDV